MVQKRGKVIHNIIMRDLMVHSQIRTNDAILKHDIKARSGTKSTNYTMI